VSATRRRLTREQAEAVNATLLRYARLVPGRKQQGKATPFMVPMRCVPSREEIARGEFGSRGKVIYPDETRAARAATDLAGIVGGRLYVYQCPRSRHGHYHVTSTR